MADDDDNEDADADDDTGDDRDEDEAKEGRCVEGSVTEPGGTRPASDQSAGVGRASPQAAKRSPVARISAAMSLAAVLPPSPSASPPSPSMPLPVPPPYPVERVRREGGHSASAKLASGGPSLSFPGGEIRIHGLWTYVAVDMSSC